MKVYTLTISKKQLRHTTDMLRYDQAYNVIDGGDDVRIEMLGYTPARWESFGVQLDNPPVKLKVSVPEFRDLIIRAEGFLRGVRFAQRWSRLENIRLNLVEDN